MAMERFTASRPAPRITIFRISGFNIASVFSRKYKDRAIVVYFLRIIAADKSNTMQKFILILLLLISISVSDGFSQNRSIQFIEKPWQEIVAMAKQENKMIFLDAYASWCGPCKWMAANIFTNDTIAAYYNKTFICASFDMEKGEGLNLRTKYGVRAYPSLLFINTDENMVHERVGAAQKVKDYIDMAKVAQNPEDCLAAYLKKYNAGNNSPQFIQTFLCRLADAYIPVSAVMKKYFTTQNESDLFNRVNWNIIYRYVSDINDPMFEFLFNHHSEYAKAYSMDSVNNKISDVYMNNLRGIFRNSNSKLADSAYLAMKEKIKTSGFEGAGKVIFTADLEWLQGKGKNKEFLDLAFENMDKYYADDYNLLSKVSWIVSSMTTESKYMEKALSWSKRSVSIKEEPFNTDTYASLLFKMGKKDEAIEQEKKVIAIAKKRNISSIPYEEALKKMEEPK
jgi:thiol-disulfide isomerase/thioredoxin